MKSFIRYLYEYQNGKRTRNTGFVKVLEQTDTAEIQIYGRGFPVAGGRTLVVHWKYISFMKRMASVLESGWERSEVHRRHLATS